MRILITGSSGLVGSACMDLFTEKGDQVFGIDADMRSYFFGTPSKTPDLKIDIRDEISINRLFRNNKFDAIIHTAAQPSHDWSQREPMTDFDINARGTLILLEATRRYCPNAVFVYVSTDKVYGENMKIPESMLRETETRYTTEYEILKNGWQESIGLDFAGQRSLFGCSKLSADLYVQEYGNYFGMKTVCFRPGCITGKQHEGAEYHGFLAYLAKCIKKHIPYKIFGYKGKQVRDQIHAYDLANAFWHFIQNPKIAAVYNIGGGPERSVSVLEAKKLLEDAIGNRMLYTITEEPRKGDRQWDVHDTSKFMKDYPEWKYRYSLDEIINDLL